MFYSVVIQFHLVLFQVSFTDLDIWNMIRKSIISDSLQRIFSFINLSIAVIGGCGVLLILEVGHEM